MYHVTTHQVVCKHLSACAQQLQQVMVDSWTTQEDLVQSHLKPTLTLAVKLIKTLRAFNDEVTTLSYLSQWLQYLPTLYSSVVSLCCHNFHVRQSNYHSILLFCLPHARWL